VLAPVPAGGSALLPRLTLTDEEAASVAAVTPASTETSAVPSAPTAAEPETSASVFATAADTVASAFWAPADTVAAVLSHSAASSACSRNGLLAGSLSTELTGGLVPLGAITAPTAITA
jgi:hypothetical protein